MTHPTKGDSHAPFSRVVAGLTLTAAAILFSSAVTAQPICNTRDKTHEILERKYQEKIIGIGVTSTGGLIEVLSTDDGKTWTIIVTTPQGISCLVATGEGWRGMARTLTEPQA